MKHTQLVTETDIEVTPGNVHDSVAFDEVYEEVTERFPEVETLFPSTAS